MEDKIAHSIWTLRVYGYAFWSHECTPRLSTHGEWYFSAISWIYIHHSISRWQLHLLQDPRACTSIKSYHCRSMGSMPNSRNVALIMNMWNFRGTYLVTTRYIYGLIQVSNNIVLENASLNVWFQCFLMFEKIYRIFVKDYSNITIPFNSLRRRSTHSLGVIVRPRLLIT